jgi:hypothetical protein
VAQNKSGDTKNDKQMILGSGLPDGIFSNQKSQFGEILEALGIEKVGIYSTAIWYILRPFGKFYGHLIII